MPRPFLIWPDKRLSAVADPVTGVDDGIRALWDEMLEAMYAMPGIGLAAPQLGVLRRVAVLDCSDTADQPVRLANPEILVTSAETSTHREASPNLPGISAEVTRPATVTVAYLDATGARVEREYSGLWATSVQHQIDHLNGRLFIDRLSPVKRRMALARFRKTLRRT